MIRQNVRIPDTVIGDLNAQIAACNVGVRRLSELAATLGHNALPVIFETLLARSEAMTREALRQL
jgi:N-methylhydantoinase B